VSSEPEQNPEAWFHELATHYVEAQIYFHLNQAGVFERLPGGGSTAEIAAELELDAHVLGCLLEYAAAVGSVVRVREDGVFELTSFGHQVAERYGRSNGDAQTYNLFDVRVGAWGPVWSSLGAMLTKQQTYGVDFHRAGEYAADGLFKLAAPLAGAIDAIAGELEATTVVELGPTSGIMAMLASKPSGAARRYVGIDIKPESLAFADRLARQHGVDSIEWVEGDLFSPDSWLPRLENDRRVLFFSCHFHEFLAHGRSRVEAAMQTFNDQTNTAGVVALEQPCLDADEREGVSTARWLYTHSNVLIHHLIKNARILSGAQWHQLLLDGGSRHVWTEDTDGFGFSAYVGSTSGARA